jgi:hypothetical protein
VVGEHEAIVIVFGHELERSFSGTSKASRMAA